MDIFDFLASPAVQAKNPAEQLAIRQAIWDKRKEQIPEGERLDFQAKLFGQAGPQPSTQPPSSALWNLVRAPLALARGAVSALGVPVDIANLPSAVLAPPLNLALRAAGYPQAAVFQPAPIPGGSADIAAALTRLEQAAGVPAAGGGWERLAENVPEMAGSMMTPGIVLRGIAGATQLPRYFSTGRKLLDALIGAGSGVGKTAAQALAPGSPVAETVGTLLGGVGPITAAQLAEAATAKTLSALGARPLTPAQQALREGFTAEGIQPLPSEVTGAASISSLVESPRYSLGGRTAMQRAAQEELQQGERAFTGALEAIPAPPPVPPGGYPEPAVMATQARRAAEEAGATRLATAERPFTQQQAAVEAQSQARLRQKLAGAETGFITERAGLAQQQQARLAGRLEATEAQAAQAHARAQERATILIEEVNQRIPKLTSAAKVQEATTPLLYAQRRTLGKAFEATEAVTGERPVVAMTSTKDVLTGLLEEATETGFAPPRGTAGVQGRLQPTTAEEAGLPPISTITGRRFDLDDVIHALTPENIAKLPPAERAKVERYLAQVRGGMEQGNKIPFWVARRLESKFRELGGVAPIGTIPQGAARKLHNAIRTDIDRFMRVTPKGQLIKPDLARAKAQYRQLHAIMNDSAVTKLFSQSPHAGEEFLDALFAGDKLDPLRLMKEVADPETWTVIQAFKFSQLYDKSMIRTARGTEFSPALFLRKSQKLQQSGQLDYLAEPGSQIRDNFDTMLTDFSQAARQEKARVGEVRKAEQITGQEERAQLTQQQKAAREGIRTAERAGVTTEQEQIARTREAALEKIRGETTLQKETAGRRATILAQPPDVSFRPGDINATLQYQAVASPQEFDLSVQRWAQQVQRDVQEALALPHTTRGTVALPSKIVKELNPLIQSGQLPIMLKNYPGLADRLTNQVDLFTRMTAGSERMAAAGLRPSLIDRMMLQRGLLTLGSILAGMTIGGLKTGLLVGGLKIATEEAMAHLLATKVRTPTGFKLLSEGLSPKYSPAAIAFAARILGTGQLGGGPTAPPPLPAPTQPTSAPVAPSRQAPAEITSPQGLPDKQATISAYLKSVPSRQQPALGQ